LIGLDPGEESLGWDIEQEFDAKESGWADRVSETIPRIEEDEMVLLRRLERKLNHVEEVASVPASDQPETRHSSSGGSEGFGTGGEEVANEIEERGNVN
jgi:hypothetical protein